MDKRAGAFVVIEGAEGSGKSTQLELLKQRLEAAGHRVALLAFPRYEQPSSYFVRRYLDNSYGKAGEVGPYTSSLFYALDRFEAVAEIRRALREGKIVLCNRFTGSNMAHQGLKIDNAEERRGFFIWLDNLEFEMLRIPRPDLSFILRVPADIIQRLATENTDQAGQAPDPAQLARTVAVYDDLAQLFPKDFQRIDCVRSGQLLDPATVQSMLWEKVSPLLPEPSAGPNAEPAASAVQPPPSTSAAPVPEAVNPTSGKFVLEQASALLIQKVAHCVPNVQLTYPDIPAFYTPATLIPAAKQEYEARMNTLLGLYAKLVAGLAKRGIGAAEARAAAELALPVAAAATIHITDDDEQLESLIATLLNDPLPEAQAAGAQLLAQIIKAGHQQSGGGKRPIQRKAAAAIQSLADEFLNEHHIGEPPAVQLTAVWPRNELDLVPDMLYEHTSLPLSTIRQRVAAWPMDRKLAVFEAYASDEEPGPVFAKAHYSWELMGPYAAFRTLQKVPVDHLAPQTLTPRYGYEIPAIIEEADLADTFEACGDLSLQLYSLLQQAGHAQEAQYATLFAHKQRWQLTLNGRQLAQLLHTSKQNAATPILQEVSEKLAEVHPGIAETLTIETHQ